MIYLAITLNVINFMLIYKLITSLKDVEDRASNLEKDADTLYKMILNKPK